MKLSFKHISIFLLSIGVLALFGYVATNSGKLPPYIQNLEDSAASVFFTESSNPVTLKNKYDAVAKTGKKVKILIVPGHEPKSGGALYKNLKERDMTVDLALKMAELFNKDPHYEVVLTRGKESWNPDFENYFTTHQSAIEEFIKTKKAEMNRLVDTGAVTKVADGIEHVNATPDVARRLYGINKWANENGVDMLIHIHFSEYPRPKQKSPGKWTGFVLYIPDAQYSNGEVTNSIANYMLFRLASVFPISNLPKESSGIVKEQDLIAIGSFNTLDSPSVLVEYGYIYDELFATETKRETTFNGMAKQTFLGIQDFFAAKIAQ